MGMSRLTRDGTAESVSRDQILRRERGQGNIHFPCSANHVQDWQTYPVDSYFCYKCDHTYIYTYIHTCTSYSVWKYRLYKQATVHGVYRLYIQATVYRLCIQATLYRVYLLYKQATVYLYRLYIQATVYEYRLYIQATVSCNIIPWRERRRRGTS